MATLSAAMVTLLTDNWAGAGATPTFGALIDYQKDLADTTEQVIVRLPIHEDVDPQNDIYSNFKFTMQIRVKSTVSEDRLKVLTDETIRIINTYAITGITRQFAKRGENTSDRKRQVFSYDVWANLEEHWSTGGTAYGSPGAGDVVFPADITVLGGDIKRNAAGTTTNHLNIHGGGQGEDGSYITVYGHNHANVGSIHHILNHATGNPKFRIYDYDGVTTWTERFTVDEDGNVQFDGDLMILGSDNYLITSDDATYVGQVIGVDMSNCVETYWHKGLNYGELYSTHRVKITAVGNVGIDVQPTSLTLSNDTDTITLANIADLLMFGSANAAYVPCSFMGAAAFADVMVTYGIARNVGANDMKLAFLLPKPCNKGSLKLYISNAKYGLSDADVDDFINTVVIYGGNGTTQTQLDIDNTNHDAAGDKTFSGAVMPASAIDCSGYQSVYIYIACSNTGAQHLDLGNVRMECYYAA